MNFARAQAKENSETDYKGYKRINVQQQVNKFTSCIVHTLFGV